MLRCRRAGAARLTAVIPYFGYARQDRRTSGRESVGARVIADLLKAGGLDRVVAVDLHSPALEGFFSMALEHLTAVPLLAEALRHSGVGAGGVVVAPDLGAARVSPSRLAIGTNTSIVSLAIPFCFSSFPWRSSTRRA